MHQEIKDRIIHLLEEIIERAHSINQQPHGQAGLEIDLVMEDLRSLYRQFDLLRRLPGEDRAGIEITGIQAAEDHSEKEMKEEPQTETGKPAETGTLEEEQVSGEEGGEEVFPGPEKQVALPEEMPGAEEEKPAEPTVDHEPETVSVKHEEPEPGKEILPEPPAKAVKESAQKPQSHKVSGPRSVLDLFADQSPAPNVGESLAREDNTLHKRIIAQKEDRSIGTRLQMTPVSNLKDAIGVNEKFLFINELFGGNIQIYHETIARLNSFNDMAQAFDYLNELNELLGWDEQRSAQTIEKLANFVQRRYMER